jgi:hypothetical protein
VFVEMPQAQRYKSERKVPDEKREEDGESGNR